MSVAVTPEPIPGPRGEDEEDLSVEELLRRQGITPVASPRELAHPELWDSEEEYEAFLADLHASRRAGMA